MIDLDALRPPHGPDHELCLPCDYWRRTIGHQPPAEVRRQRELGMTAHYRTRMARGERGVIVPERTRTRRSHTVRDTTRIAASRLLMEPEVYRAHVEAGEKWCSGHQTWHVLATTAFTTRRSAKDGLASVCKAYHREYAAGRRA